MPTISHFPNLQTCNIYQSHHSLKNEYEYQITLMSKRTALHEPHNNTRFARGLVALNNHASTGRQIRRQMF